jgi:hydrogenase 3 maturation protease
MSKPSWRAAARATLQPPATPHPPPKVALLGIGNELNGDDAAGVRVAESLLRRQRAGKFSRPVLIVNAGLAPENVTGAVRRFGPDLVILVDAAELGEPPGTIHWLAWQETTGLTAATHALPPYMVAQYLTAELGCQVALIGIQRKDCGFGSPLSPPVRRAVRTVSQGLATLLEPSSPD